VAVINGTEEADNLFGGPEDDLINGFGGNDGLNGHGGRDELYGGAGDDLLAVSEPLVTGEILDGGAGTDTLYLSRNAQTGTLAARSVSLLDMTLRSIERLEMGETLGLQSIASQRVQIGWEQIGAGLSSTATISGRPGEDRLDILLSAAGNYVMPAFSFSDWRSNDSVALIVSGTGNYALTGSDNPLGTEALIGGPGNDVLTGRLGVDVLTGGAGANRFVDTAAGLNGDTITDLRAGDYIVVSDANANFSFALAGDVLSYSGGSVTLRQAPSGYFVASAAAGGGVALQLHTRVGNDGDVNGDGRADAVWRNDLGTVGDWLGTPNGGFSIRDGAALVEVPANWAVTGRGDFNGDGRDDILWRNDQGTVGIWTGKPDGGFSINETLRSSPASWRVAGTGDFNGDGRDDILWRNDGGGVGTWSGTASGGFTVNSSNLQEAPNSWQIAATGDFEGDGRSDILWRSADGSVGVWSGTASASFVVRDGAALRSAPTSWHILGAGDFNGDGRSDILWRENAGQVGVWLGNADGSFTINEASVRPVDNKWHVAAIGDYNGDHRDDLLWHNEDGTVTDWLATASGNFIGNDANLYLPIGTLWQVQPEIFA
jgi:hypothetical protein